jgi:predicted lipoprotein with Yx(FWY)xxD motif
LTWTTGPRLLGAAVCAAALGLAAACGSSPAPAATAGAPVTFADTADRAAAGQAATGGHSGHSGGQGGHAGHSGGSAELELYAVQTGTLGIVVTDGNGRVLYGSSGDQTNPPQSHCTDACAQSWLPLTVATGQEPELLGVDATAVGRLARPDGTSQLTLGGWPVYVNRSDDGQLKAAAPGLQASGWFAMSPAGEKVAVPG